MKISESPQAAPAAPTLLRRLGLVQLTLYGLGTTVGAGVYALLGEAAGEAGMWAPASFLMASLLAAFTALSFAELSARYPKSAGEAIYVREGLGRAGLATAVGLLVALAGSVSAATISNGLAGHLHELAGAPHVASLLVAIALMTAIACWGIAESVTLAGVITLIEVVGLCVVIFVAREHLGALPDRLAEFTAPGNGPALVGVFSASLLAFYAFLGFEDMVNVAEEIRDVRRTLPLAIGLTLIATTVLYVALSLAAVLTVPPAELAASEAPVALVFARATGGSGALLGGVALIALTNGALIQVIMASRVLYGLSAQGSLPAWIGRVDPRMRTPVVATGLVGLLIAALAVAFPLAPLARATSLITLVIFALVNLALVRIQRRGPPPDRGFRAPAWVPVAGATVSAAFVVLELGRQLAR